MSFLCFMVKKIMNGVSALEKAVKKIVGTGGK